jgi:ABC-type lipoprotein release transport system permease subunit
MVSGILERTYSQDNGTFFIPLARAQKLVNCEGKLSAVALKLSVNDKFSPEQHPICIDRHEG